MKLVSEVEIENNEGYKKIKNYWQKAKSRYLTCPNCKVWIETKNVPNIIKMIKFDCPFCHASCEDKI